MVQINFALREVNCKIVFYGPGLSGKTTNLEIVHKKAPEANKGELTSIATEGDRTLFFDFMPLDLGTIAGMRTRFQLYTVPGQVYYNSTRKLVLQGVDGVVFVADSSESKMEENLESLENLKNNLAEYGKDIRELPVVLQYNKRDLPDALPVEVLNQKLNPWGAPYFEAVAITGEGVFPTLKCLSGMVLETLNRDHRSAAAPAGKISVTSDGVAAPVPVAAAAAVAAPVPVAAAAAASPPRPQLRTGATAMDQVPPTAPAASRPQVRPAAGTAQVRPGAGSAHVRPGGSIQQGNVPGRVTQNRMRKVEATPLQQTIRTTPASSTGSHRMVKLPPERKFPWLVVGLVILTVGAAAAVLGSLGFLTGSGE